MSEPVSALTDAKFDGIARVEEIGLQGMITLRGDLGSRAMKSAATAAAGTEMPGIGRIAGDSSGGLCWMSPDELLLLCPYETVDATLERVQSALKDSHALAVNVSDARAVFRVGGPHARDVLAKLCPVDLSPEAFGPGNFRRTRMAQIPAAIWLVDDETFQIVCFRSVAQYAFDLLRIAAQPGSEVGLF